MRGPRHILWGVAAVACIIALGVVGYYLIEGWPFVDALYMTIISISTVGFAEVHPLSSAGKMFTLVLIVLGVGGATYTLTALGQYLLERQFGTPLWRRRMEDRIARLKEHFILCGYGRVGREVARILSNEGADFVVIDREQEVIAKAEEESCLHVHGDAASDDVLRAAGIERARGLVAALGSDIDNTYVVLSARSLRPDLFIVARASAEDSESKLKRAGADRIILPELIGGRRMAMIALRPAVVDFIDTVMTSRGRELILHEVEIGRESPLLGLNLAEGNRYFAGARVMAIKKRQADLVVNPGAQTVLERGDRMIVLGTTEQLTQLEASL